MEFAWSFYRVFQKFVPIINCILRKAFNASLGKCKLIQERNLSNINNRSKQFQTKICRKYNFFSFLPQLYTHARFFLPYFSSPFCRFSILVFLSFSFIFSTPLKAYTVCARAQASIFMVFWPLSQNKIVKLLKKSER